MQSNLSRKEAYLKGSAGIGAGGRRGRGRLHKDVRKLSR